MIYILFLVIVKTGIEAVLVLVERLIPKSEKDTQKRECPQIQVKQQTGIGNENRKEIGNEKSYRQTREASSKKKGY